MVFQHQTGDDFSTGGSFLREPGVYHVTVFEVDENPHDKDMVLIENAAFRVGVSVLAGTVEGQQNKTAELLFFHPKLASKNEGAFARKQIDRFLLAVGLMTESDKSKEISVDLQEAVGRHFVVKLEKYEKKGKEYLRISYTDIWHVDDPAVKDVPTEPTVMAMRHPWRVPPAKEAPAKRAPKKSAKAADNGAPAPVHEPAPFTAQTDDDPWANT